MAMRWSFCSAALLVLASCASSPKRSAFFAPADKERLSYDDLQSVAESALKAEVVDKLLAAQKAPFYDVSVPGNPTYRATP